MAHSPLSVRARSSALTLVAFPPTHLTVLKTAQPTTAAQALEILPEAVALIDGPIFAICPGSPTDYASATCGDVDTTLLDEQTGANDPGGAPTRGITFALKGSELHIARGEAYPAGSDLVIQTWLSLVVNGRDVTNPDKNKSSVWRAAVGVLSDGQAFLAVGQGSMTAFSRRLVEAGATWAGYTDGGGSTALALRGDAKVGSSENRRVASWIGARATPRARATGTPRVVVDGTAGDDAEGDLELVQTDEGDSVVLPWVAVSLGLVAAVYLLWRLRQNGSEVR